MRLAITIDGVDFSSAAQWSGTRITKQIDGRQSTATLVLRITTDIFPIYGSAIYNESSYFNETPVELGEVIISNADTAEAIFRGNVVSVNETPVSRKLRWWRLTCVGLEYLLDTQVFTADWEAQSDRFILQQAYTTYLPEITTFDATVDLIESSITLNVADVTLRELNEKIKALTGGIIRVTEDKELSYKAVGATAAVSFNPNVYDGATVLNCKIDSFDKNHTGFANRVRVLGGVDPVTEETLIVQVDDLVSQAELVDRFPPNGVVTRVIADRTLTDASALQLVAQVELGKRAVQQRVGITFWNDGLNVGELVTLTDSVLGISGSFLVQSLSMRQIGITQTEYSAQLGDFQGDLAERIRQLEQLRRA
jgi:hypothetical protein